MPVEMVRSGHPGKTTAREAKPHAVFFFFQAEDGIRDIGVTGVQTCALPISPLFEDVQEQLEENRRRNRRRAEGARYLLQGLLVCQSCGYAFCGRWQVRHTRAPAPGYHYYHCTGTEKNRFDGQRRCGARPVLGERLDTAVRAEGCRLLEDPARVTEEYQRRTQA